MSWYSIAQPSASGYFFACQSFSECPLKPLSLFLENNPTIGNFAQIFLFINPKFAYLDFLYGMKKDSHPRGLSGSNTHCEFPFFPCLSLIKLEKYKIGKWPQLLNKVNF
jgi:hypothetical protein